MRIGRKIFKHFLKPDHILFLGILPAIYIDTNLALFLWGLAFVYDIYEETKFKEEVNELRRQINEEVG